MSDATKGQFNRKIIREKMESKLPEYCPNPLSRIINLIAYDFNLAPDTVRYSYVYMFISKGILYKTNDCLYHVNSELIKRESEDSGSFMDYVKKKQQKKDDKPNA